VVGPGGRAAFLDTIAELDGDADFIPDTPAVTAVEPGTANVTSLVFETTPFSDPQGPGTFGAIVWRVGEVTDPEAPAYDPDADQLYEWNAVWTSGVRQEFASRITVPPSAVRVGHSYRIRARMMDDTGRWGHWSAPIGFIPAMQSLFMRGDANADGMRNIADAISILSSVFGGGEAPACAKSADANDDGQIDIADPIRLLGLLFAHGPDLDVPFDTCGADPTTDSLSCASFPPCR
jgi:hypothetical protein